MDTTPSHLSYDELDSPHDMACDCQCACDHLHLAPGSAEHRAHLAGCDTATDICDLHIDDSAVRLASSMELHLD